MVTKKESEKKKYQRKKSYTLLFIFLLFLVLSFFILKPFITTLLMSLMLSVIFYPLYNRLLKRVKSKNLSSTLMVIVVFFIIILPFIFIIQSTAGQVLSFYDYSRSSLNELTQINHIACDSGFLCDAVNKGVTQFREMDERFNFNNMLKKLTIPIVEDITSFIFGLPSKMIHLFIVFFTMFYFFKHGPELVQRTKTLLPLNEKETEKFFSRIKEIVNAVVYGYIITAGVQSLLAGIGYFVLGFNNFLLLAILTFLFALVPFLGAALIWILAALYLLFNGLISGESVLIAKAIGLTIYGTFGISLIDNILRPKLIGEKANINAAIILVGVLGGLYMLGFIGILLGPLILAITLILLEMLQKKGKI